MSEPDQQSGRVPAGGAPTVRAGASPEEPSVLVDPAVGPPRAIAGWLSAGAVVLVVGFTLLVAAVHESLVSATWEAATGSPRLACDSSGYCEPEINFGVILATAALVALAAGAWLLGRSLRELGRRSDAAVGAVVPVRSVGPFVQVPTSTADASQPDAAPGAP